jgi:DNA-binding CsgD family transcriptional regulator
MKATRRIPQHGPLTERELEILSLLSSDKSAGEIGATLDIAEQTVNRHLHEIYMKLGFNGGKGRLAAAHWYWENYELPSRRDSRNARRSTARPL